MFVVVRALEEVRSGSNDVTGKENQTQDRR